MRDKCVLRLLIILLYDQWIDLWQKSPNLDGGQTNSVLSEKKINSQKIITEGVVARVNEPFLF